MANGQINLADANALQAKLDEIDNKVDSSRVLTDVPAGAVFTDTQYDDTVLAQSLNAATTKLAAIEAGATADQTGAEIKLAYEAELDTNAYTDAEKNKVANALEAVPNATATVTGGVRMRYDVATDTLYLTNDGTDA